jgi:hypothetical protein
MVIIASKAAPIVRAGVAVAPGRVMDVPPNVGAFDCAIRLYNDTTGNEIAVNAILQGG